MSFGTPGAAEKEESFGELCQEFDKQNSGDTVYNLITRFLVRYISSGLETMLNYFLHQLCKLQDDTYHITDSECLEFIRQNLSGNENAIKAKIEAFEAKLSFFID